MGSTNNTLRHKTFQRLRQKGMRVYPSSWMCLNFINTREKYLRVGWTISRRIGNAVVRNKIKRWGRQYFRKQDDLSMDINVVLKPMKDHFYRNLNYNGFIKILERGFKEALKKAQDIQKKHSI